MLQSEKLHVVDVVLLQLFCGWCRARFFLCRSCYRGEGYCGEACRKASRLAIRRRAEARYRRSAGGRRQRAERSHYRRQRRRDELALVAHLGSAPAHDGADWSAPSAPISPMGGDVAGDGGSRSDVSSSAFVFMHEERETPLVAGAGTINESRRDRVAVRSAVLACSGGAGARCNTCQREGLVQAGSIRRSRDRASHKASPRLPRAPRGPDRRRERSA